MNIFKLPGLRKFEYRFGPYLTGNTLGFEVNWRWKKFHNVCKRNYKPTADFNSINIARQIKKDGLAIIGQVDVSNLSFKVSGYFKNDSAVFSQMPTANQLELVDDIYEILEKVKNPVGDYFKSHFRPYWISVQKTSPGKVSAASSFGWHIDDNPKQMIKIFVYLNDVKESNGAFRAFPWNISKKILKNGFRSNSEQVRIKNHEEIDNFLKQNPNSLKILEGEEGTVLAFDNNLVHKGTAPREKFRLDIQIPVIPSLEPFTKNDVKDALASQRTRDYPRNPFIKDFAN